MRSPLSGSAPSNPTRTRGEVRGVATAAARGDATGDDSGERAGGAAVGLGGGGGVLVGAARVAASAAGGGGAGPGPHANIRSKRPRASVAVETPLSTSPRPTSLRTAPRVASRIPGAHAGRVCSDARRYNLKSSVRKAALWQNSRACSLPTRQLSRRIALSCALPMVHSGGACTSRTCPSAAVIST